MVNNLIIVPHSFLHLLPKHVFLLKPPLGHDFAISEKANRLLALSVQYSKERIFRSPKWKETNGTRYPNIYTDITSFDFMIKFSGAFTAASEKTGPVAIVAAVNEIDCFIKIPNPKNTHHWPKYFLSGNGHVPGNVFKYIRTKKAGIRIISDNIGLSPIQS